MIISLQYYVNTILFLEKEKDSLLALPTQRIRNHFQTITFKVFYGAIKVYI